MIEYYVINSLTVTVVLVLKHWYSSSTSFYCVCFWL